MTFWDLIDKHIDGIFAAIWFLGFMWMVVKLFNIKDE